VNQAAGQPDFTEKSALLEKASRRGILHIAGGLHTKDTGSAERLAQAKPCGFQHVGKQSRHCGNNYLLQSRGNFGISLVKFP
jgi:hypothetical protein